MPRGNNKTAEKTPEVSSKAPSLAQNNSLEELRAKLAKAKAKKPGQPVKDAQELSEAINWLTAEREGLNPEAYVKARQR